MPSLLKERNIRRQADEPVIKAPVVKREEVKSEAVKETRAVKQDVKEAIKEYDEARSTMRQGARWTNGLRRKRSGNA